MIEEELSIWPVVHVRCAFVDFTPAANATGIQHLEAVFGRDEGQGVAFGVPKADMVEANLAQPLRACAGDRPASKTGNSGRSVARAMLEDCLWARELHADVSNGFSAGVRM